LKTKLAGAIGRDPCFLPLSGGKNGWMERAFSQRLGVRRVTGEHLIMTHFDPYFSAWNWLVDWYGFPMLLCPVFAIHLASLVKPFQ
jgi:hypothetical protein